MRLRFALAGLLAMGGPILGQRFEVASIKPSAPETHANLTNKGGRIVATGFTVRLLMIWAYGVRADQIEGGPAWITSDRFDIQAKAEGSMDRIPEDQMRSMLQALLEERFQIKVHRSSERASVYALTVAKNGPKFQESTSPAKSMGKRWSPQQVQLTTTRLTMDSLARMLTSEVGRPVNNRTGLPGEYDIKLEFAKENAQPDSTLTSVFTALPEQLGLRLEGEKGDIETLVIDSVSRPSEN